MPDQTPTTFSTDQIEAIFSDVLDFPKVFKDWLVAFLGGSDLSLPASQITGVSAAVSPFLVTSGFMIPFAGASGVLPTGWLICDGAAVSRVTYSSLFAIIGTTYGVGDGSTTFNLPDAQGRSVYGLGTHADVNALGKSDGFALSSRTPVHTHSLTQSGSGTGPGVLADGSVPTGTKATPFIVTNWAIKT